MPRRWLILSVVLTLFWGADIHAQDSAVVRMGFLLNFARYVEWPESVLKPGAPLRICLAPGDSAMASQIDDLTKQFIHGRPIQVRQPARPTEAEGCQVIYLPVDSPPASLRAWLTIAAKSGTLTVGEVPDFIDSGGMIGLESVSGRYRFDVNLGSARQADLRISAYLLKLARTVK
jgi:hypothetical protein